MVEIRLESVSKRYGETTALSDVSITAREGEFFTLVGPSGCGKTTTLRTIAGFEQPTTGGVYFDDRDVSGVPPERRDAGIVFQNYALFPHMSVAENVAYGLRFRDPPDGVSRTDRVTELLDLVDLAGMGERDPDQLSGGQRQRVALARALAPSPGVLLLDEPMSALDARLRESLRRQLTAIQSDLGITTVYVTHDQEEALAISDRVAVMSNGRVEQVGTPQEIYRRPATEFVAEFVGENNLFSGTVTDVSNGVATVDVGGTSLQIAVGDRAGRPSAGESVTFCVRPEKLSTSTTENRLETTVDQWEFLGEAVRVRSTWNGRPITVRIPDVPESDDLAVGFEPGDAHVI